MIKFNSYITKLCTLTCLLLLGIASFNTLIDPFNFFNSPIILNLNQLKPEFLTHVRMAKAHQVRLQKPEIIILGSSRAETGLDPNHPGFSELKDNRYNLALQNPNIYEVFRYLQHAQAIHPLKQVVIGLDFFMFNTNKINEADFIEDRLSPMKASWFLDIFRALFTYDGLAASLNTAEKQQNKLNIQYFNNGFRNDNHNWQRIQNKGGHHQSAISNERYTFTSQDGFTFFSVSNKEQLSSSLNTFLNIITFCKKNNIDLRLFISPIHARQIQLFHKIGLWKEFENWKTSLVQLLAENVPDYPLWDFTGYNEITTEPFPPIGDTTTQMKWYWESSHYKKETGDLVLDRILNYKAPDRKAAPYFGIRLTPQNIEQHLLKLRMESKKFTAEYPEIIAEINEMILSTNSKRKKLFQQHPDLAPLEYFKQLPTNPDLASDH